MIQEKHDYVDESIKSLEEHYKGMVSIDYVIKVFDDAVFGYDVIKEPLVYINEFIRKAIEQMKRSDT